MVIPIIKELQLHLDDLQFSASKKFILELMRESFTGSGSSNDSEHSLEFASVWVKGEEPPMKRFKHLSRVSSLIEQEEIAQDTEASREILKEEEELDRYLKE